MGFFSNRRNKIIEKEIENAFLLNGELHDTNIYWQAFERFAQDHGGTTDKHADGGQDTGFEMITNGIEVKVMAIRDRFNGTADIKVQTLADFKKEADKFLEGYGLRPSSSAIEDEDEFEDEFEDEDILEDEDEEIEDGEHIEYYENGQIKSEKNYKDGKKHGKQASWYENGQLSYDEQNNLHYDQDGNEIDAHAWGEIRKEITEKGTFYAKK